MTYLIDGHNLIGKIPWLDLSAMDDEIELIQALQVFARKRRKQIEVYFDRASPGFSGKKTYGNVVAFFVTRGHSADDAILARLRSLGKSAANSIVVSSDRTVQVNARENRAKIVSSEVFAGELKKAIQARDREGLSNDPAMDEKDVDFWLDLFDGNSFNK